MKIEPAAICSKPFAAQADEQHYLELVGLLNDALVEFDLPNIHIFLNNNGDNPHFVIMKNHMS